MLEFMRKFFMKHLGLKFTALILALAIWFYVANELKKGTEEERQFLNRALPNVAAPAEKQVIKD